MTKSTLLIGCALLLTNVAYATVRPSPNYEEHNHGIVSYDVSMPIDATNYTLHGSHLTGGHVSFSNHGTYLTSLLAHETGEFKLPTVTNLKNKPLIKTHVKYEAIKFINPAGIDNIFIKIGFAARQQEMHGLDPFVIKNGSYTWQVPFFAFGKESNTVKHNSENIQFMQVGSLNDAADNNAMYTQDFYLYLEGKGKRAISGHPIRASRLKDILARSYSTHYQCHADGLWASGAPFRTVKGSCSMTSTTFPAGPDLDYETGRVDFPTVYLAGWKATPQDHAIINGKKMAGVTPVHLNSYFNYMAKKIRIPLTNKVTLFAEYGSIYRIMEPSNLRYQCKSNVYINNMLPRKDCYKKSYLPGGYVAPYFAVGYETTGNDGTKYAARYIYTPGEENANRLVWRDASVTHIYAISASTHKPKAEIIKHLNGALDVIRTHPALDRVLGKHFFAITLNKLSS